MHEALVQQVLTTLEELVDPQSTALVVIDMQNDFCSPEGSFGKRGSDVSGALAIVPAIQRVLAAARQAGTVIVHSRSTTTADLSSLTPAYYRYSGFRYGPPFLPSCLEGSWGHQIIPELAPLPGEVVIDKQRHSLFHRTRFDEVLRARGIRSVVLTGVMTQACVESTARDAVCHDYYVVVLEDAVGTSDPTAHATSLANLRNRVDVALSEEVARVWSRAAAPVAAPGQ